MRVGTARCISVVEPSLYLYTSVQNTENSLWLKLVVVNSGEISDGPLVMHSFVGYPVTSLV